MNEQIEQSVNQYLRNNNVSGMSLIELNLTLKKGYILASADITRLKFFSPSIAHIAFLVHNFEPMIDTLIIKLLPDEKQGAKAYDNINSIEAFYKWLNSIQLFQDGKEFNYIHNHNNNLKQWQENQQ